MMVWLDLETSALEPDEGVILEIAAIVVVPNSLVEGARFHAVLQAPKHMESAVERMHTESGLLRQCQRSVMTESEAERDLTMWLSDCVQPLYLAGSGVSHFDMRWLKARMPEAAAMFEYATIDVGVLRRSLRMMGQTPPVVPESAEAKRHRAMADVEAHLDEFRRIAEWMNADE